MIALPVCPAGGVLTLAVKAGCATVLAQLGLVAAFRTSSDPVLKQAPGYVAHQLVALVVMLYATTFGLLGWLNPPATVATAAGRLLVVSDSARFLAATLLGALVAWDIPTSLAVPRLRKPDVLVHHLAMAATALVGCTALPTHYGLYYMGAIELSSVPLTVYDAAEYATEAAGKTTPPCAPARVARLRAVRDSSRTVAALSFIAVRAVDFTRVTLLKFVPDALSVLRPEAATPARFVPALRFMVGSSVSFVGLQLRRGTAPHRTPRPGPQPPVRPTHPQHPRGPPTGPERPGARREERPRRLDAEATEAAVALWWPAQGCQPKGRRFRRVWPLRYWLSLFVRISAAQRKRDQRRAAKGKAAAPEEQPELQPEEQ